MFAERFDALMNIAGLTNAQLGKALAMNPSHIGRLRSGARPLAKKHDYLWSMCMYLATHMKKEYQIIALQKLTGIGDSAISDPENIAIYIESWLLEEDMALKPSRLTSGPSRQGAKDGDVASFLYGNPGKRRGVEQLLLRVLQEDEPQTLLLFSDENMDWLYEDRVFARRGAELFHEVIKKGNRIRIIHNLSRDRNELIEAVTNWIPVYLTGMVEAYYYPKIRDGLFQRTLFLAPKSSALISCSVKQDTSDMLNVFVTDSAALEALSLEFERYFKLCRPLLRMYTEKDNEEFQKDFAALTLTDGASCLYSAMPPVFAMPQKLMRELTEETGYYQLPAIWKQTLEAFKEISEKQPFHLALLEPELALKMLDRVRTPVEALFSPHHFSYTKEQYLSHLEGVKRLAKNHRELKYSFHKDIKRDMMLFVKEGYGVVLVKEGEPTAAMMSTENILVKAFWEYLTEYGYI